MTEVNMYEREAHATPLKSYEIPTREPTEVNKHKVRDLEGNHYYVSKDLLDRIKASLSKGVDRPTIRTESDSISGLYTPSQVGYLGLSTDGESDENRTESDSESKRKNKGVSDWVDNT